MVSIQRSSRLVCLSLSKPHFTVSQHSRPMLLCVCVCVCICVSCVSCIQHAHDTRGTRPEPQTHRRVPPRSSFPLLLARSRVQHQPAQRAPVGLLRSFRRLSSRSCSPHSRDEAQRRVCGYLYEPRRRVCLSLCVCLSVSLYCVYVSVVVSGSVRVSDSVWWRWDEQDSRGSCNRFKEYARHGDVPVHSAQDFIVETEGEGWEGGSKCVPPYCRASRLPLLPYAYGSTTVRLCGGKQSR